MLPNAQEANFFAAIRPQFEASRAGDPRVVDDPSEGPLRHALIQDDREDVDELLAVMCRVQTVAPGRPHRFHARWRLLRRTTTFLSSASLTLLPHNVTCPRSFGEL